MNILNKLTIKNLKLNKKRTIVTIIGIILSVALIMAVVTMYSSAIESLINFEISQKGDYHAVFYDVPNKDINLFKENRKIDNLYLTRSLGYANLYESKNKDKPYAYIMEFNKEALQNLAINLNEGRLPKNENEIVIPTHLKTNGRVELKVGDNITLDIGSRIIIEDNETINLSQNNSFLGENEQIINTNSHTYKIVGIINRPSTSIEEYSAPGYTFITYMKNINENNNYNIYLKYTKDGAKEPYKVTAGILGVDDVLFEKYQLGNYDESESEKIIELVQNKKYNYSLNEYLIMLETNPIKDSSSRALLLVVLIVCGIIIFTSVYCIKNSFDISITEKIKQYGMLKSIGATKKQIRKNVLYEAFILGIIGIPIGLLCGIFASFILIIVSNYFLSFEEDLHLIYKFSYFGLIFSVILSIITIYLSAIKSARKASKISAVDSIRNSSDIKIKRNKIKSSKLIDKLFGIGGTISYKNMKRNKKKYRTTIFSITTSVLVFIALSSFSMLAYKSLEEEVELQDYNIWLSTKLNNLNNDTEFKNKFLSVVNLDNVEEYSIQKSDGFKVYNFKFDKEYSNTFDLGFPEEDYIDVYSLDDNSFKNYLKKLGLNYEKEKDNAILINEIQTYVIDANGKQILKTMKKYDLNKKDKITISYIRDIEKKYDIEVNTTNIKPFSISISPIIVIRDETFNKLTNNSHDNDEYNDMYIRIQSSNANKLQDEIEKLLNGYDYNLNNSEENIQIVKNLYTLIAIFLYGFIIVISLIGITNIFNTITTSVNLRRQEFAMLKSIGMTKKEFNRMIRLETLFIGIKSLTLGIVIGTALSYLIYKGLNAGYNYTLPITAIIISIICVFLLINIIMKYSINKINKQNTIETIRNENI